MKFILDLNEGVIFKYAYYDEVMINYIVFVNKEKEIILLRRDYD